MTEDRKRMTARRARIEDIVNGEYYKREGFEPNFILTPRGMRLSRVLLVATVVDSFQNDDGSYGSLTLDDGTDTIRAKFFQDLGDMEEAEEGDIVEAVGKVRKYDGEIYVQPELLRKKGIQDELLFYLEAEQLRQKWQNAIDRAQSMQDADHSEDDIVEELKSRGLEQDDAEAVLQYLNADQQFGKAGEVESPEDTPTVEEASEEDKEAEERNRQQAVLDVIEEHDTGEGADYSDILEQSELEEDEVESVINELLSDGTCYEPKPGRIKKL